MVRGLGGAARFCLGNGYAIGVDHGRRFGAVKTLNIGKTSLADSRRYDEGTHQHIESACSWSAGSISSIRRVSVAPGVLAKALGVAAR
jgi:hypothetical protein